MVTFTMMNKAVNPPWQEPGLDTALKAEWVF